MRRVVRRVFGAAVAGFCLLSLLACLGAGWLWWRSERVYYDQCEATVAGTHYEVQSMRGQVMVAVMSRWPGPTEARAFSAPGPDREPPTFHYVPHPADYPDPRPPPRRCLGVYIEELRGSVLLGPDGMPVRWDTDWPDGAAGSDLLTGRAVNFPDGWIVAATALPPVLWLAAHGRRAWVRRRRARLGLCLRCAYDLRGSPSGVCPECGAGMTNAAGVAGGDKGTV